MRDSGQADRPAVLVLACDDGGVLAAVLAGIEEEGVPAVTERPRAADGAAALARRAAGRSSLAVGVGVDARGGVCVHHDKLPDVVAELSWDAAAPPTVARALGHNAARIVVGIPLRAVPCGGLPVPGR